MPRKCLIHRHFSACPGAAAPGAAPALYNVSMEPDRQIDPLIVAVDRALRAVFAPARAARPVRMPPGPGEPAPARGARRGPAPLPDLQRDRAARSRRADAGEPCRRGRGPGALPRPGRPRPRPRDPRNAAAGGREEADHLAWCQQRLRELDSRPSVFWPLWYAGSFAIGALPQRSAIASASDSWRKPSARSRATSTRISERLPAADTRSRAILEAMRHDEIEHGEAAISAGGSELPAPARELMRGTARVMTFTSYWV